VSVSVSESASDSESESVSDSESSGYEIERTKIQRPVPCKQRELCLAQTVSALLQLTEAVEVYQGNDNAQVLITCEHASQRMPHGWRWPDRDRRLIDTHWAYDLGAAELARSLGAGLDAPVVLSRFTRLLVDPNRPEHSNTLFRDHADGQPVEINQHIDEPERRRRIDLLFHPYHAAIDRQLEASRAPLVLAMHTFTPIYEGERRNVEVGVLFDREEDLANAIAEGLSAGGIVTELNEPYSGRAGMMYAAEVHAQKHGRRAIELEVRQDLAIDPLFRAHILELVRRFL
jgi:predicted N-formylglutamate amidohydrolase